MFGASHRSRQSVEYGQLGKNGCVAAGAATIEMHMLCKISGVIKRPFELVPLPKWAVWILGSIILCLMLITSPIVGWAAYLALTGNIHTVEKHALYRSAQLDGDDLEALIRREGIATVLNLRGANANRKWYREELQATAAAGAGHFDLGMSANQQPDRQTLRRLIELLRTAPKPILVHCMGGADRSGLAAALYEFLDAHKSAAEAARQLSFWYGHFPWLTSKTGAMDRAFASVTKGFAQAM